MESSGGHRSGLLTAGGVLSIVAGVFEVIGGGAVVALVVSPAVRHALLRPLPYQVEPPVWPVMPSWLIIVGVPLLVLGAIAIVGGISAVKRKSSGLSLAGAICALPSVVFSLILLGAIPGLSVVTGTLRLGSRVFCTLPSVILGILAVIFVVLGKREFEALRG